MPRDYSKIADPAARAAAKKRDNASSAREQAKMNIKTNWPAGRAKKAEGARKKPTGTKTGGGF